MNKFRFNILIATVFYLLVFLFPKISEATITNPPTKTTTTPTVVQGGQATYTIRVTNNATAITPITISDTPLTTGTSVFTYASSSVVMAGAVTNTGGLTPTISAGVITWGTFNFTGAGTITITLTLNVPSNAEFGTYNNTVVVKQNTTTRATFTGTTSTTEDVIVARKITGKVFNDNNHNGLLDASETGISGVQVVLYKSFAPTSLTIASTDVNGDYTFLIPVLSADNTQFYYIIENANASSLSPSPPLSNAPSGMGGTTILKQNTLITTADTAPKVINFGNYSLNSQTSFFDSCPVDGYISEGSNNSQLSSVNLLNNLKTTIGRPAGLEYNAMSFNTNDKFLYAVTSGYVPQLTSELVRIDINGIALSLGEVSGLPNYNYGAGDYNPFNGLFYVQGMALSANGGVSGGTTSIYAINISTKSATVSPLSLTSPNNIIVDFSFNPTPSGGVNYMYATPSLGIGIYSSDILKINPTTGSVTVINIPTLPASTYIASFFDPENNLYVEDINTNLYKIHLNADQTGGTVTSSILNNIPITRADGARCPFANLTYSFKFTSDNQKYVVPGAIITYPHRLIAGTDGSVSLNITNTLGWPFTVFEDVNANNILDAGDLSITNFSNIGNVFTKPYSEMNLLIRVQVPLNTAPNITDVMKIIATLTPTPPSQLPSITIINIDQTTVTKPATGELMLIKTAKTYSSDGVTVYDATGRTARPGYYIDYFIDYKNISSGTIQNIKITDFVPAYTTLINSGFTDPATGTIIQATPLANTKDIIWNVDGTLAQTEAGQVFFRVKLN